MTEYNDLLAVSQQPLNAIDMSMSEFKELIDECIKSVIRYESLIKELRFTKEYQQDPQIVEQIDHERTIAHNKVIADMTMLNRICLRLDLEPVIEEKMFADRKLVAKRAHEMMCNFYCNN